MVFLVLAAQYESWSLPLAVILVVPMCLLERDRSACNVGEHGHQHLHADRLRGAGRPGQQERDPDRRVRQGDPPRRGRAAIREATLEACRLRLRPIIMTSLAFILGVLPLLIAHGAGAEMRRTLGTAVFSGMLGVTLFGIFLTPVFFYLIDSAERVPLLRLAAGAAGRVDRAGHRSPCSYLWRPSRSGRAAATRTGPDSARVQAGALPELHPAPDPNPESLELVEQE